MNNTISNLKEDVTPKLHGTTLNKVSGNFFRYCLEAANRVLAKIDPRTTIRSTPITNAIYSKVYDYIAPVDLKGNKVSDIRPYNRSSNDSIYNTSGREFDIKKYFNSLNVKDKDGLKFLRVSKNLGSPLTLHTCDSVDSDGTWVASEDASGLDIDTYLYLSSPASLFFNLDGVTGTAKLTNSTMSVKDFSTLINKGAIFLNLFWGSSVGPTSIELRFGSDSSNYYSKSVTTPHEFTTFKNGWNLLRFDLTSASTTGSPDSENIDYVQIIITYATGTAISNIHIDSIVGSIAYPFEIEYYSSYLFKSSAGVYKQIPTVDTDTINLDSESYNIFLYELLDIITQVTKGGSSSYDSSYFRKQLDKKENVSGESGLYEQYQNKYPSESLVEITEYYNFGFEDNEGSFGFIND